MSVTERLDSGGIHRLPPDLVMLLALVAGIAVVGVGAGLGVAPGLAALVAVLGGLALLRNPLVGVLVLVAVVPVLPGLRRGFPLPGFRLTEILIAGVAVLILLVGNPRAAVPWRAFDWVAFAYVVATPLLMLVNLFERGDSVGWAEAGDMLGPLQFFLLYRVVVTSIQSPHQRQGALRLVLLASVPVALIALLQQFDIGPTRALVASFIDRPELFNAWEFTRQARATSVFPHWHPLAGYLMLVVTLGTSLLLTRDQRVMGRRALLVVLTLTAVALVYTATITAILGAIGAAAIVGLLHRRFARVLTWTLSAVVVITLVAGPYLGQRFENQFGRVDVANPDELVPQGLTYRVDVWRSQFLPVLRDHWVTGYGPGLPPGVRWRHTESAYLTFLLRGGVPLLVIAFALLGVLMAQAQALRRNPEAEPMQRSVACALIAAVIMLLPMQAVYPYLTSSGLSHLLWVLAGLAFSGLRPGSSGRAASARASTDH